MEVAWLQVPSLEKVLDFKAHEGEIEDLTFGPDGKVRRWGEGLQKRGGAYAVYTVIGCPNCPIFGLLIPV
jgi:hypothetical protein